MQPIRRKERYLAPKILQQQYLLQQQQQQRRF